MIANSLKYIVFLAFLCMGFISFAQEKKEKDDTFRSRFRPGIFWNYSGFSPPSKNQNVKYDRLMVDIAYNGWYGDRAYFSSPWQSIGFTISMMFDFPMAQNDVASFGLGISYSHYTNRSKVNFIRNIEEGFTTVQDFSFETAPQKVSFGANYFEIPFGFRFRTIGWEHFKIMIGAKIGYNFNSFFKHTRKIEEKMYTEKYTNFPDLNPLRYGVTARIGTRNWALFGAYYFSPFFLHKKSVQLYPFSLGITVSLF